MDGSELLRRHLAHMRRRGLRPNTIELRTRVLRRLELHAGRSLNRIDLEDIRGFLDRLTDPGSRAAEATQLRSFYQWATLEGYIPEDPTYRLESIRKRRYVPRPIPDELLGRALDDPPERVRPMLWLAAYAGLRACDIAQLRGEHLMFDRSPPMIFIEESKGGTARTVPMGPILVSQLRPLVPRQGWCFTYEFDRTRHIPAQYVSKLCNDYLHSMEITETLHQLRHWFITKAYTVNRNLVVTQELAGHSDIATTRGYTWVDPGAAVETVNQLPMVVNRLSIVADTA